MIAAAISGDVGAWLWQAYQFSPPLMLAILTVVNYYGYRKLYRAIKSLQETTEKQARRIDKHEILIDNNADRIEGVEEAANENENRLIELETREELKGGNGG